MACDAVPVKCPKDPRGIRFYRHTTALIRLIDNPSVRARHVRDSLGLTTGDDGDSGNTGTAEPSRKRNARSAFGRTAPFGGTFASHFVRRAGRGRSEEHTSELQSLMRISYAVFCLKKKNKDISYSQVSRREKTHVEQ